MRMNADYKEKSIKVCREQDMELLVVYRKWLKLLIAPRFEARIRAYDLSV